MSSEKERHDHHTKRDAETLEVLGIFLGLLSLPVLAGTFWASNFHAGVVNVGASLVLMAVAGGFIWRGRWTRRHLG